MGRLIHSSTLDFNGGIMKTNFKNILITISFMLITTGFMVTNLITPDHHLSYSERRQLISIPKVSLEKLLNGELFSEYEKYFLDQFTFRDQFRSLKAYSKLYVFKQKDHHNIYYINDGIYKMEYPLNVQSVNNMAKKMNEVYNLYLEGMNVHYAIIPDKNYYVAKENEYLSMDYNRLNEILNQNVKNIQYINLYDTLSITDYYRTDLHWSQDKIVPVADLLLDEMGNVLTRTELIKNQKYPFYGSYYGQGALPILPDSIIYLTNEVILNAM